MIDEKLIASLAHPARRAALAHIAQRPASPEDIAAATGLRLGTVAYHVRVLRGAGIVEPDHEERIRGAVKHVYRLAPVNGLGADVWALGESLLALGTTLRAKSKAARQEGDDRS